MRITIVGKHDDNVAHPLEHVEAEAATKEEVEAAIETCVLPPNYYVSHVLVDRVVVWEDGAWTSTHTIV